MTGAVSGAELLYPLHVPLWIDLTAVVVGTLAGAAIAAREELDVFGALLLAVVMGLGGGIVRDLRHQPGRSLPRGCRDAPVLATLEPADPVPARRRAAA